MTSNETDTFTSIRDRVKKFHDSLPPSDRESFKLVLNREDASVLNFRKMQGNDTEIIAGYEYVIDNEYAEEDIPFLKDGKPTKKKYAQKVNSIRYYLVLRKKVKS